VSHPFAAAFIACSLLALGWAAAWYAQRRRAQDAGAVALAAAAERAARRAKEAEAAARALAPQAPAHAQEWDGGQPRPNFNRLTNLDNGMRQRSWSGITGH